MFQSSAPRPFRWLGLSAMLLGLVVLLGVQSSEAQTTPPPAPSAGRELLTLRSAFGVPDDAGNGPEFFTELKILDAFQKRYPSIKPISSLGLRIPGNQTEMVPMMQIAGNIAPDIMRVNFHESDTYIRHRFLYPLDKYLEGELGANIPDGPMLSTDDYLAKLKAAPRYAQNEMDERIPRQVWDVIRRECPYGDKCPYLAEWKNAPAAHHYHIWCLPQGVSVTTFTYEKALFAEAGLPDRVPRDMDEMYEWAKLLTDPAEERYGLALSGEGAPGTLGWATLSFLFSCGGRVVEQDANGQWRCCFDSDEAVNAYYFVARLFAEPFERTINGKKMTFTSVVGEPRPGVLMRYAMSFTYLDDRYFGTSNPEETGFGPVPADSRGHRGNELNSGMTAIYAGLDNNPARRDAAWKFIFFLDSAEARRLRADVYVENGSGRYLSSRILREAGYPEFIRQIPKGWEESLAHAIADGVPEPYGKNCQHAYRFLSEAIDQIRIDEEVTRAIQAKDQTRAKTRIRQILHERVVLSNEKMLDIITPEQRTMRNKVATVVSVCILLAFIFLFYRVITSFSRKEIPAVPEAQPPPRPGWSMFPQRLLLRLPGFAGQPVISSAGIRSGLTVNARPRGHWQFDRHKLAYVLLFPALGSIALWAYYPLARGTIIAFQDYNVRGFSTWVGMENFANVLFDGEFWHAMWISLKYGGLYLMFGFFAPIILAFLLTEVPRGKILFRTIYYLPAVLSGAVLMFLWKGFYGSYGLINQLLNFGAHILNYLPHVHIEDTHTSWLENPHMALLFVLLPTIWAGMGPGCLIYLAALKTVPEEIYEAAEIDGAGIWSKLRHVAIPGIRGLVAINFIGALIGTIHGGGEMVLAMTGGGPYTPYGSTEVIGLHIYWQGFAYLRFGAATAMAWVLGAMLIGFTVMQLSRLSKMEFRTSSGMPTKARA